METRVLGNSGLEVSTIGLGCMGLNFAYGKAMEKKDAVALLQKAVEKGVTFFDSAEAYGPFTNEELLEAVNIMKEAADISQIEDKQFNIEIAKEIRKVLDRAKEKALEQEASENK